MSDGGNPSSDSRRLECLCRKRVSIPSIKKCVIIRSCQLLHFKLGSVSFTLGSVMKPILAIGAVVLLFIAQPGLARDGLYRWTDEQGVRHFSDHPPLDNKPLAGPVEIKKKESSPSGSAPAMSATTPLSPSVSESPIKATQEMILGKWKPSMSQIGNEVAEQMKTDSGKKMRALLRERLKKPSGTQLGQVWFSA